MRWIGWVNIFMRTWHIDTVQVAVCLSKYHPRYPWVYARMWTTPIPCVFVGLFKKKEKITGTWSSHGVTRPLSRS